MMTAAFLCAGFPDPHGLGGFHCGFVLSCQLSMLKFGVHEVVEEVQGFKGFVFLNSSIILVMLRFAVESNVYPLMLESAWFLDIS